MILTFGLSAPFFCFCYRRVSSQKLAITPKVLHLSYFDMFQRSNQFIGLERVEDISVDSDLCMNLWGTDRLTINVVGSAPIEIYGISNPERVREQILMRQDKLTGQYWAPQKGSIPTLAAMLQSGGMISEHCNQELAKLEDTVSRIGLLLKEH